MRPTTVPAPTNSSSFSSPVNATFYPHPIDQPSTLVSQHSVTINPQSFPSTTNTQPISSVDPQPQTCDRTNTVNTHPMRTRSKNGIFKPKQPSSLKLTYHTPKSIQGALKYPN
jgi:hypothetical protein